MLSVEIQERRFDLVSISHGGGKTIREALDQLLLLLDPLSCPVCVIGQKRL